MSINPQDIIDFASNLYDQTFGKFSIEVKSAIIAAAVEFTYQGFQSPLTRAYIFKLALEYVKNKMSGKDIKDQLIEAGKIIDQVCVWGLLCGNNLPDQGKRGTKGVSLKAKKSMAIIRDIFNLRRNVSVGDPHTYLNVGRFMGSFPERMLMIGKLLSTMGLLQNYNFTDRTGFANLPREMQFPQMASLFPENHPLIDEHKAFCIAFDKLVNSNRANYKFDEQRVLNYWSFSYRSNLFNNDARKSILQKYSAMSLSDGDKEVLSKVVEDKRKSALASSKDEEDKGPISRVPKDEEEEEEDAEEEEDTEKKSHVKIVSKKLSEMIYAALSADEIPKLMDYEGNLIVTTLKAFKKLPAGFKKLFLSVDPSERNQLVFSVPTGIKEGTLSSTSFESATALKKELQLK